MENNKKVSLAAGTVGSMTLLSRLFGFIRDLVIAMIFGASPQADAFFVAFRIPNIQRRILGEGAVTAAMIPLYGEYLKTKSAEETDRFTSNLFNIQLLILLISSLAIFFLAPYIIMAFAPGFIDEPAKFEITVTLTQWMAPYLVLVGIAAYCMGILNSHGIFALPAAGPILLNICMILGAWIISPLTNPSIIGLAIGVLLGGIAQLLVQLPATFRCGFKLSTYLNFKDPGVIRAGKLLLPGIVSFGVYEVNLLVDTLLGSLLAGGSISYLYYANRLVQLPLGVFGVALSIALLPMLTQQVAQKNFKEVRDTLSFGIRLILFITVPATIGLILLSFPIVNTLWERGEFLRMTTEGTSIALVYFSVGLCAFSGSKILVSAYYSLQDTKTPMRVGIYSMLLNIGLGIVLMNPLKHGGLALASSISSIFNAAVLVYFLKKKLGRLGGRKIINSLLKLIIASTIMGLAVHFGNKNFFDPDAIFIYRLFTLIMEISCGVAIFIFVSRLLKNEEWDFLVKLLKDRKLQKKSNPPVN